ncbi:DUF2799 domain-containing protein [Rheinheimera marina]|uniref:DUF2799 domain-containing protein n=1 Tax=Rheinheimera marina TaxID=1774958 RepID=A0ABV9JL75_9GAMM
MKHLLLLLPVLSLVACSSISQQECQLGDWFAIGKTDAQQGIEASKFRSYQQECAKHGLSSDFQAYQQGHAAGAIEFCQYDNGVLWGQQGKSFNPLCSGALETEFRLGYERGRQWYGAKVALENLQQVFEQNNDTIKELEQRIDSNTDALAATKDVERKQELTSENKSLRKQLGQLQRSQGQLQRDLQQAELNFSLMQKLEGL